MLRKCWKYLCFSLRQALFYLLSALVPKNRRLWVFGAWEGRLYADNAKYLFEYANAHARDIRCVWLSGSAEVVQRVRAQGCEAYRLPSFRGRMALLRAGAAIQTEGNRDLGGYRLCRTKVIQLWHGVAPKRANWNDRAGSIKRLYNRIFIDDHARSYWMASSEQNSQTLQELFGASAERIFVTGYPRNDVFCREGARSAVHRMLEERFPGARRLIYMPTHRNFGTEGRAFSGEEMLAVDARLRENNMVMVFKPHFHELANYLEMAEQFTNIVLATQEALYADVYDYINDFDLLISDYSSIIYDFLCSGKPVVLFPYDLEHFRTGDAGLFDYYEGIPAGPLCFSWGEVIHSAARLLEGDEVWRQKRELCRQTFHPFADGNNSARVCAAIRSVVGID